MNTTVTVYRSLSNRRETATVSAGQSVAAAFPEIDFGNAAVIVNGRERSADYVLRESDVVTIRVLPSGMTTVAIIALAAIAIGVGIYGGVQLYKAKRAAEEAQKELDKIKKQSNNDDIDNRPFLRGASNTSASGKTSPYVCGRHLFTPYLLGSPFYRISGEDGKDQHVFMAFACGFGGQVFDSVSIDDVRIKKFDGGEPQEGAYGIDAGIFAEDGLVEIAQDGKPFGELDELNYKVVSAARNDEIPRDVKVEKGDAEHLVYTLDANAMNVTVAITFPYGLYAYNDDGDKISTRVKISTEYSTDGGQSWERMRSETYNRSVSSKELRFTQAYSFDWDDYKRLYDCGQKNILLRVRSDGNDDAKIKNDCYVLFYQSKCFDPEKSTWPAGSLDDNDRKLVACKIVEDRERALCAIMGLRIKSTTINEDKLKKVSVISQGTARTWNGRSWSAAKSATRNPAAWALEILTSPSHPISRFSDGEIDLDSFGEFYEYCESKEYRFDYVMTEGKKKGDVLNLITGNCDSTLYLDLYGRMAVATDRPQGNAIAVYNPQNIITIQNKKTFGRRTDGLRVKYVNSADDLFQEDTYLLMREVDGKPLELGYESAIKDVTVTGITEFRHVVKYARRLMATEALRPKTTTIEVGGEGVYFTPYSKILLQDESLKIGTGSGTVKATQWENGTLRRILLDSYVTFEKGKIYGAIVNCFGGNGATPLSLKVSGDGHTDTLTVETAVQSTAAAVPEAGCVVSFGELDGGSFTRITTPYLISGISRSDKGFRLELANYNDAVYASGTIPDYRSNLTQKPPVSQAGIPPDYVTKGEMMDAIVNGIDTSAEPPDTPMVAECRAQRDYISARLAPLPEEGRNAIRNVEWQVSRGSEGGAWTDFQNGATFSARYEFARGTDGYPEAEDLDWRVRCRVTNTRGIESEWSAPVRVDASQYGTWRVSSAANARARTYGSDSIGLLFDGRRPNDRTYYGSTRFTVIVKYDGKPVRTEADAPFSLHHYFDRAVDGYPERHANAADGIRDLSLYSFTIRPVESVTGEVGTDVEVDSVDDSGYGTWLIPPVETSAEAGEHSVLLQWSLAGAAPYGTLRYDVFLGGKPIAENVSGAYRAYRFDESLSKEQVAALEFSVRARNEAHERTEAFSVDASRYLGYEIGKPWTKATASREGISVSWDRTNDFYGKCEYALLKDGTEAFSSAREKETFLPFGEGEFPEKGDIARIDLRVRIDGDAGSVTGDAAEIDVSGYLTYIPAVPKAYPSASGRSATLSWDRQDGVYGFLGCEIQIAKAYKAVGGKYEPIIDDSELEWFAPALGLNPYESLDNYKRGEEGGRLEVRGTSVTFPLPLFGQDGGGAADTQYAFRLRGRSEAGKASEWTDALFVTCRAVSAYDVTKAWDFGDGGEKVKLDGALGARQIFVEELAAISANLGFITDGALRGNAYNYWAVGDTPMEDGSTLWRGSFRVGGKDQYILVEPRLRDGVPTDEYDITFVVGNYSVSASGTQIRGGAFEVYDTKGNLIFRTGADGNLAAVEVGNYYSTYPVRYNVNGYFSDVEQIIIAYSFKGELYVFGFGSGGTKTIAKKVGFSEKGTNVSPLGAWELSQIAVPTARTDGSGKANFVYERGGVGFFGVYDAATNSWDESAIDSAEFERMRGAEELHVTDYGAVYWTETERSEVYVDYDVNYIGIDGKSAVLFQTGWLIEKGRNYYPPMYRDEKDAVYAIYPGSFMSAVYRLNKSTYFVEQCYFFISGQTAESAGDTVDIPVYDGGSEYPVSPRVVDGRLLWLMNGNCLLGMRPDGGVDVSGYQTFLVSMDISDKAMWQEEETKRVTVYVLKPSVRSGERAIVPTGFSGNGSVCPICFDDSPSSFEEHRLKVDDTVPDPGYEYIDYREGALTNEKVCDVSSSFEDLLYYRNQCTLSGAGGVRICFVSNSRQGASGKSITTFYATETAGEVALKPMMSGVGFYRVLYDELSGRYRYCLDPATGIPAVLEFDKDGRLAAAKGDKGDPGDKGEKGDKGDRADTNNVWPVGSVWVTDDSSLNASAMFGGSWNKTNVLIGFKTWYYWKRNS